MSIIRANDEECQEEVQQERQRDFKIFSHEQELIALERCLETKEQKNGRAIVRARQAE